MDIRTINGRTYTRKYAWWPTRTRFGELVWFTHYYIRPDRNGYGCVLTVDDFILETSSGQ